MAQAERRDPTVLVVDDEPNLADLFSLYLEPQYDVRTAYGGNDAIEKVDETVDVALLDRRMPSLSGDEVAAYLRESELSFPIAMVTAVKPTTDIFDLPIDDYLKKPVEKVELLSRVEALLKREEYDAQCKRFFRLAAKKAAFEKSRDIQPANIDEPEYRDVVAEIEAVESELTETLTSLSQDQIARTYRQL